MLFANHAVLAARLESDLQHAFYLFSSGYVKTGIKETMEKTEQFLSVKNLIRRIYKFGRSFNADGKVVGVIFVDYIRWNKEFDVQFDIANTIL